MFVKTFDGCVKCLLPCASQHRPAHKSNFGPLCNLHLMSALASARRSSKQGAAACIGGCAHSAISASPPAGRRTHPCLCAEAGWRLLGSHPRCCSATTCSVSPFLLLCLVIPCFRHTGILNRTVSQGIQRCTVFVQMCFSMGLTYSTGRTTCSRYALWQEEQYYRDSCE